MFFNKSEGKENLPSQKTPDQFWFFIHESTLNKSFFQGTSTLQDIKKNGISLQKCLHLVQIPDHPPEKFSFYIHSESMAAAVNMLHDRAIMSTWEIYCTKDKVVCIHIRDVAEDSPNVSQAASHQSSLAERRKISRSVISEIVLRPRLRDVSKDFDVVTDEPMQNFLASEKVVIDLENGETRTFTKDYLLSKLKLEKLTIEVTCR
jgi:hypothetical protein